MSAVNFWENIERRPYPRGDRVVITCDGKFLDYVWDQTAQKDLL
jgi:cyanate lyase